MDKSHMFWGLGDMGVYEDGIPVPRKTYRCKTTVAEVEVKGKTHLCKKVTDHPGGCLCICGVEFNPKEEVSV